jgi:DeoR/GlpR family transcriptional regulator of sugar metabolism
MDSSAEQRRSAILQALSQERMVKIADLSKQFSVSQVSIRRDLERLEQLGLLKRIHGGAVDVPKSTAAGSAATDGHTVTEEKERIARAAAVTVRRGERLVFDSGTTVQQIARHLSGDLLTSGNLTIITPSRPIVQELGSWKGIHLLVLGGVYLPEYQAVVGPLTIDAMKGLHADRIFLGTDGLTFAHGVTTANVLEAEAARAMVKAASKVVVVAESRKIGLIGLTTIIPLASVDTLITDDKAPEEFVAALRAQGVEIILA